MVSSGIPLHLSPRGLGLEEAKLPAERQEAPIIAPGSLPLLKAFSMPSVGKGPPNLKNFLLSLLNGQGSLNQAQVHSFSTAFDIDDNTLFVLDHYTLFPFKPLASSGCLIDFCTLVFRLLGK